MPILLRQGVHDRDPWPLAVIPASQPAWTERLEKSWGISAAASFSIAEAMFAKMMMELRMSMVLSWLRTVI
jgi:hypothetical protein